MDENDDFNDEDNENQNDSDIINVEIVDNAGNTHSFSFQMNTRIKDVKKKYIETIDATKNVNLTFNYSGKILDPEKSLEYYNMPSNVKFYVLLRMKGGF